MSVIAAAAATTALVPKKFNFPLASIHTIRDCIFLGLSQEQKDAYLTNVLNKIIHSQANDHKGNTGICCVIVAPSPARVQWTLETIKRLKEKYGTMEEFHKYEKLGDFVNHFDIINSSTSKVTKCYSMIIVGQPYSITMMLQRGTLRVQSLKHIVLDLDFSNGWINNTGFLNHNYTTLLPLFQIRNTKAKMIFTAPTLNSEQLEFVTHQLKHSWNIHMALPTAKKDTLKQFRNTMLIDQINECEPSDRVIVFGQKLEDLEYFSKLSYKSGKGTLLDTKKREATIAEFEKGDKNILFILPYQIAYFCIKNVTRLLNYDLDAQLFYYVSGFNEAKSTWHSFDYDYEIDL